AWGLLTEDGLYLEFNRSIPTCVGPAWSWWTAPTHHAVHPHVRGACVGLLVVVGAALGPSPRAWGLPWGCPAVPVRKRSIPTCVGPATGSPTSSPRATVHPHVRGACACRFRRCPGAPGPSPRAWGLHRIGERRDGLPRSIPTCVGPAWLPFCACGRRSVHPHVRGACSGAY